MFNNFKRVIQTFVFLSMTFGLYTNLNADIKRDNFVEIEDSKSDSKQNQSQEKKLTDFFDNQRNSVSNLQFYTSNYGIFGLDVARNVGGGFWPRGSQNQYLFGGGIWFAAEKIKIDDKGNKIPRKYVEVTYNPNNGRSWMTPGRLDEVNPDKTNLRKYRTYFSTDFNSSTGKYLEDVAAQPNWPIWDDIQEDTLKKARYFGHYIYKESDRTTEKYPKGPAFISGEDIFCSYHDNDLTKFDGGKIINQSKGYPLGVQFEQMIYSWGFGDYKNFIFVKFDIISFSKDTLYNCWMAPIMDVDIARQQNSQAGAGNDRVRYYNADPTLNMAFQWSDADRGERGNGFGYLGFDFLESPAVIKHYDKYTKYDTTFSDQDPNVIVKIDTSEAFGEVKKPDSDFVRKDKKFYPNPEQLGLVTFRNWSIADDKIEDVDRYQYLSGAIRDGDTGPGDKRFMMATGPFHVRPFDTTRVVVGIVLAQGCKGGEPDGSDEDVACLANLDKFAQTVYDNNFKAPEPPARANITDVQPLNNGMIIKWDANSELSIDAEEDGLDFMGYSIYRARREDRDTFALVDNPEDKTGPFGWKMVESYSLPLPMEKSYRLRRPFNTSDRFFIDSLKIAGVWKNEKNQIDTMSIKVMRVGKGVRIASDSLAMANNVGNSIEPIIFAIDTNGIQLQNNVLLRDPWALYYSSKQNPAEFPLRVKTATNNYLLDSIFIGRLKINRALVPYNPMFFRRISKQITQAEFDKLPKNGLIRKAEFKDTVRKSKLKCLVDGVPVFCDSLDAEGKPIIDRLTVEGAVDTVYVMNTFKRADLNGTLAYTIDMLYKRDITAMFNDKAHMQEVLDSAYSLVQQGLADLIFPDFEGAYNTKTQIIAPYMEKLTRGRTFQDLGDDDGNGVIEKDADPTKTEKILNNVPYFYKVLAYDQGDINKVTSQKINTGSRGLTNFVETFPAAAAVGSKTTFSIIDQTQNLLGGLNNFNLFATDEDRVVQQFAGDTLELTFEPDWSTLEKQFGQGAAAKTYNFGTYSGKIMLKNVSKNQVLMQNFTQFGSFLSPYTLTPCKFAFSDFPSEYTVNLASSDTLIKDTINNSESNWANRNNRQVVEFNSQFTTSNYTDPNWCVNRLVFEPANNTLGFSFDFAMRQNGGYFRPDFTKIKVLNGDAKTNLTAIESEANDKDLIQTTQFMGWSQDRSQTFTQSANYGNGVYEIEFLPGGDTTMKLAYNGTPAKGSPNKAEDTWTVKYLNLRIKNVDSYETVMSDNRKIKVTYPGELAHIDIKPAYNEFLGDFANQKDTVTRPFPDPRNLIFEGKSMVDYIGKFNISAYAWVDARTKITILNFDKFTARKADDNQLRFEKYGYSGYQGKYFLSATSSSGHVVDFSHVLNIAGVNYIIDYANKGKAILGKTTNLYDTLDYAAMGVPSFSNYDFEAGDKIQVASTGGVFGLPLPGAKVRFKVNAGTANTSVLTDDDMSKIKVVPNPYYISHEGQKSPYAAELYFTKLPKKCTIKIFTVTGELVQTLEHDEMNASDPERQSVEVWNLLTKNGLRSQSQTFIAQIKTPEGAETNTTFSIVVGSFRVIDE